MKTLLVTAVLACCVPTHAQMGSSIAPNPQDFQIQQQDEHPSHGDDGGGCEDSPENPTIILAGLAVIGYFAAQKVRRRAQ